MNFGGATKEIYITGDTKDIESLIRVNQKLMIKLENQSDIKGSFSCEVDIRGLLVREIGREGTLGGKVDGVYEMTKRMSHLPYVKGKQEEEQDIVQFLKAKVVLMRNQISMQEIYGSQVTQPEQKELKVEDRKVTFIDINY